MHYLTQKAIETVQNITSTYILHRLTQQKEMDEDYLFNDCLTAKIKVLSPLYPLARLWKSLA